MQRDFVKMELQGTYPVISITFANVKENHYSSAKDKICDIIRKIYIEYSYLKESKVLTDADRAYFERILSTETKDSEMTSALHHLSDYLYPYYEKRSLSS